MFKNNEVIVNDLMYGIEKMQEAGVERIRIHPCIYSIDPSSKDVVLLCGTEVFSRFVKQIEQTAIEVKQND